MANAKLIITDSRGFCNDIWQLRGADGWTSENWQIAIDSLIEDMEHIYDDEDIDDFLRYRLGDVINLLSKIDIEMKGEAK